MQKAGVLATDRSERHTIISINCQFFLLIEIIFNKNKIIIKWNKNCCVVTNDFDHSPVSPAGGRVRDNLPSTFDERSPRGGM